MVPSLLCVHIHLLSSDQERHWIIGTFQLSFRLFKCAFHLETSTFFLVRVSSFFPKFIIIIIIIVVVVVVVVVEKL
jgi:hypothetical protein